MLAVMRTAVRAIIIKDQQLLVMHRNKFGTEYDTLPGGNIEIGETPERALVRELLEETMVEFSNPRLVVVEHAGNPYGDQFVYLCDYASGEPQLHPDSEEMAINKLGKNLYKPAWVKLSDLSNLPFVSENLKQFIIQCVATSWPESPVEISTT